MTNDQITEITNKRAEILAHKRGFVYILINGEQNGTRLYFVLTNSSHEQQVFTAMANQLRLRDPDLGLNAVRWEALPFMNEADITVSARYLGVKPTPQAIVSMLSVE